MSEQDDQTAVTIMFIIITGVIVLIIVGLVIQ